ncbi:baeRF7 domain-containing protein [Tunicatimonas pelagia]|uniref:baeRF7 domain-containing protein n=1 Tax=Tunicatimonas pelagia TaxID=931531 RepID=UPI002665527A|nr:hypothetical protein [Tunicatimonas pelagia]WKN40490.1 hypothetical protein P0M28_15710 [Tunicatimonas pelagia]
MKTMTKEDLQTLADFSGINCVSIYIPTHKKGHQVNEGQDAILLKNHYQQIRQQLKDKDISESEANEYLVPIKQLIDDNDFWRYQEHGLAVFLGTDYFKYLKLPYSVREFNMLSTSFHLDQIVPLLHKEHPFYILAISLNKIRLLEGDQQNIEELDIQDMVPEGMEDALSYYDFEKNLQSHSGQGDSGSPIYHGHGGDGDKDNVYVEEYFRRVNDALDQIIEDRNRPVVLAAVESHHPIYREANKTLKLADNGITMNPDRESAENLHQKATEALKDYFNQDKQSEMDRYTALAGSGQASYSIEEIAPAAINGRIDALFVVEGTHRWGYIDREENSVQLHESEQENGHDLVAKSAVQTILHGGNTYIVKKEDLPEEFVDADLAAIFRW